MSKIDSSLLLPPEDFLLVVSTVVVVVITASGGYTVGVFANVGCDSAYITCVNSLVFSCLETTFEVARLRTIEASTAPKTSALFEGAALPFAAG